LRNTDKDFRELFQEFWDKKISIHQYWAWMYEKTKGVKYKTYDDMREELGEEHFKDLEETKILMDQM